MEAAGALGADMAAMSPPGMQLKSLTYHLSVTLPLLKGLSRRKECRRQCTSCSSSTSLCVSLDPVLGMPAHEACLTAE